MAAAGSMPPPAPMINVLVTEDGTRHLTDAQLIAIEELNQRNIEFTRDEFIDVVKAGDAVNVATFLRAGMSPNAVVEEEWLPIVIAAYRGYADIVGMLVDAGAFINTRAERGYTPLMLATLMGKTDAARMLVEKGADVNLQNENGLTALIIAVQERNAELVEYLVKKGADPGIKTDFGATALNIAIESEQQPVIKALERAGCKSMLAQTRQEIAAERKAQARREAEDTRARVAATPKPPSANPPGQEGSKAEAQ
jgi:ankyrin repeat protein